MASSSWLSSASSVPLELGAAGLVLGDRGGQRRPVGRELLQALVDRRRRRTRSCGRPGADRSAGAAPGRVRGRCWAPGGAGRGEPVGAGRVLTATVSSGLAAGVTGALVGAAGGLLGRDRLGGVLLGQRRDDDGRLGVRVGLGRLAGRLLGDLAGRLVRRLGLLLGGLSLLLRRTCVGAVLGLVVEDGQTLVHASELTSEWGARSSQPTLPDARPLRTPGLPAPTRRPGTSVQVRRRGTG